MKIIIPKKVRRKMKRHLFWSGLREIGGVLMAEQLSENKFSIVDFSVDSKSGTPSSFKRDGIVHDKKLNDFFLKTGHDYKRFNYLGEWHSHPSFCVEPSIKDINAMQKLVDESNGVGFAVLLITKITWNLTMKCTAHLFINERVPNRIQVIYE